MYASFADYHPEFFPEHDKKSLSLQPDLTQTVHPCYEYPYTTPATSVTRSVSEHHYDVPHLASASDIQMSPATSSTLESSSGKRSQMSGFTNNCEYPAGFTKGTLGVVSYLTNGNSRKDERKVMTVQSPSEPRTKLLSVERLY